MILHLSHHLHAARPPMQRLPNFEQHSFTVIPPLVIPKPQLLDVRRRKPSLPFHVAFSLFGQAVLKSVQFNRQSRGWTEEIEKIFPKRMLTAELEAGKSPGS